MMTAFQLFIELMVRTAFVLAVASGVTYLLRHASAAARYAVWSVAVCLLLLVPFASVSPQVFTLELPVLTGWFYSSVDNPENMAIDRSLGATSEAGQPPIFDSTISSNSRDAVLPAGTTETQLPVKRGGGSIVVFSQMLPFLIWGIGAFSVLFLLLMGIHRVWVITSTARSSKRLQEYGNSIAIELGIRRPVRIRCSAHVNVPLNWGLRRPVVLFPDVAEQWTEQRLRIVLLHELAHVKRWDYLIHLIAQITFAGHWFNPLVWLAVRQLNLERERACDDYVLRTGTKNHVYAEHLVEIAQAFRTRGLQGAVSMAQMSMLKERIRAILDRHMDRRPISRRVGVLVALVMIAITIPLLAVDLQITSSTSDKTNGTTGESNLTTSDAAPGVKASTTAEAPALEGQQPAYWFIEAEDGRSMGQLQHFDDTEASGGVFVSVAEQPGKDAPDGSSDYIEYRLDIRESGAFVIWGRVKAPEEQDNSFFVSIDGGPEMIWDVPGPDGRRTRRFDRTSNDWTWDAISSRNAQTNLVTDPAIVELTSGSHTLRIRNREDATCLDALVVTNDLSLLPSGPTPAKPPDRPVYLWMEGETGNLLSPMEVANSDGASNGAFVWVPNGEGDNSPGSGPGTTDFNFNVDSPGEYVIWGRIRAPDDRDNSFFVSLNGGDEVIWDVPGPDMSDRAKNWTWAPVRNRKEVENGNRQLLRFHLQVGTHTLQIRNREDGTSLDAVLVTNNLNFVPSGDVPTFPPEHPVFVWIEAEETHISDPFRIVEDEESSGRRYIEGYREDDDSRDKPLEEGRAVFHFDTPTRSTYTLWGLVSIASGEENSFWIRVDDGEWIEWNGIREGREWHWARVHEHNDRSRSIQFELSDGTHTLEVAMRERDTELDRLLITNDLNYRPTGRGAPDGAERENSSRIEVIFRNTP